MGWKQSPHAKYSTRLVWKHHKMSKGDVVYTHCSLAVELDVGCLGWSVVYYKAGIVVTTPATSLMK